MGGRGMATKGRQIQQDLHMGWIRSSLGDVWELFKGLKVRQNSSQVGDFQGLFGQWWLDLHMGWIRSSLGDVWEVFKGFKVRQNSSQVSDFQGLFGQWWLDLHIGWIRMVEQHIARQYLQSALLVQFLYNNGGKLFPHRQFFIRTIIRDQFVFYYWC